MNGIEKQIERTVENLRESLRNVVVEAERAMDKLDNAQRPGVGMLAPGRIVPSAADASGHCAQLEVLFNLGGWNVESVEEILKTAGL